VEWSDDGAVVYSGVECRKSIIKDLDILFSNSSPIKNCETQKNMLDLMQKKGNLRIRNFLGFSRISRISVGPEKYFLQQKEKK
jgi:hypothetical protein